MPRGVIKRSVRMCVASRQEKKRKHTKNVEIDTIWPKTIEENKKLRRKLEKAKKKKKKTNDNVSELKTNIWYSS